MKKQVLTLAIVLGLSMASFAAPDGGGMFKRGKYTENMGTRNGGLVLPNQHGLPGDVNGEDEEPLGSGLAVLAGLGAAYLVAKKRKED